MDRQPNPDSGGFAKRSFNAFSRASSSLARRLISDALMLLDTDGVETTCASACDVVQPEANTTDAKATASVVLFKEIILSFPNVI